MIKPPQITRFGLIRHAETLWNRQKRIQGHSDSPLTAEGERQVAGWGRLLKQYAWHRILASDSGRAFQTALKINSHLQVPLETDSRLREQDWGCWVGKTIPQLKQEYPRFLAEQESAGWGFCPPGGEDRKSVLQRSQMALKEAAGKWNGQSILVVTHEGVIKCLIYHLCGRGFLPTEPPMIKAYQLHRIIFDRNGLQLEKTNALALE